MPTPSSSPTPPSSDMRAVIAAVRDGDPRAETALFNALYATLYRRAVRRLSSLGPLADPSAIAASAIRSLLVKFDAANSQHSRVDHVTEIGQVWAHLFRATERRVVDAYRAARRKKRGAARTVNVSDLPDGIEGTDPDLGPEAATEMADLVEQALARLEPRERQVTELKLFVGHTMQEIADMLGVALRTAENDWTHARRKLRAFGTEVRDAGPGERDA